MRVTQGDGDFRIDGFVQIFPQENMERDWTLGFGGQVSLIFDLARCLIFEANV